jgi:SAM-dependent MidA family methyltransferase
VALEDLIRAEIRERGPMPFARFMERALYEPGLGYYRARPTAPTREGDFLTAPECHPVFGALLARFCRAAQGMVSEAPFTVVEQGAGTGALAASFIGYWLNAWADAPPRYVIIEPDDAAADRLRQRLGTFVEVVASLDDVAPFSGVYPSNELPDAFPVRRLRRRKGDLVEVLVGLEGDCLVECEGPASPEAVRCLGIAGIRLDEGREIEVSPLLERWLAGVSAALQRGYVLTFDYGYEASEAGRFPRGTLLAHFRHSSNEEFLSRVGRQDLTAHVCWTALRRIGDRNGLAVLEKTSQRDFLTRWGWKDYGRTRLREGAGEPELDAIDRLGREEDGLGRLGVLTQAKGIAEMPRPEDAGAAAWGAVPLFQA